MDEEEKKPVKQWVGVKPLQSFCRYCHKPCPTDFCDDRCYEDYHIAMQNIPMVDQ